MKISVGLLLAVLSSTHIGLGEAFAAETPTISAAEASRPMSVAKMPIQELQARMEQGDLSAQAELGARFGRGDGVVADVAKAILLLQDAASRNNAEAQHWLGTAYMTGVGVSKNESQAALLFEKAADQGHPEALYMMGVLISNGQGGFAPSWTGAYRYFWRSAEQGFTPAEFMMGYIYQEGLGVDIAPRIAAYWYRRTHSRNPNVKAAFNLARLIGQGLVEWQKGDPVELSPELASQPGNPLPTTPRS